MEGRLELPSNEEFLKAKIEQVIKRLFVAQLCRLEEIYDKHDEAMTKLVDALPPEQRGLVTLADYLTDSVTETTRRKVLFEGNEAIRDLKEVVDNLRIN